MVSPVIVMVAVPGVGLPTPRDGEGVVLGADPGGEPGDEPGGGPSGGDPGGGAVTLAESSHVLITHWLMS